MKQIFYTFKNESITVPIMVKVKVLTAQSYPRLFATQWIVAWQAPLSMNSPGKNTGVSCHFLLQGIFLIQGSNPGLLHCRQNLYRWNYQGSPINILE